MFAQKLINLRKSRGLTQEQLALEIFVSRSMIAKYETGKAYQVVESAVDYAQVVWNADFAQWQLYYYEQSNPNILQKRAFVHITEWDLYENSRTKAKFTIEGRDWFEQFNKHNISPDDYRELKTVTLYYTVTTKKTLLGDVRDVNYKLIQVDFHLV